MGGMSVLYSWWGLLVFLGCARGEKVWLCGFSCFLVERMGLFW